MSGFDQFRLVAGRELRESLRRRSVRILFLLLLAASTAAVVLPEVIGGGDRPSHDVAIAPSLHDPVAAQLDALAAGRDFDVVVEERDDDEPALRAAVDDGDLDAAVLDHDPPLVLAREDADSALLTQLGQAVGDVALVQRLTDAGLDPAAARTVATTPSVRFDRIAIDEENEATGVASIAAVAIYLALIMVAMQVANGTAIEKSNRISEVLLAVVRPGTLLFGKVIGVGLISMIGVLALIVPIAVRAAVGASLPASTAPTIAASVVWFVLGVALYAPVSGALGALVERQEEVGTAVQPITIVLIGGYFASILAAEQAWVVVLSVLPLTSPLVLPARVARGDAELVEIALSAGALAVAAMVAVRVGGVVYRRAIVRTGHRLRLRELRAA